MTTGRVPRIDPDLAVTLDELDPVRAEFDAGQDTPRVAVGSEPHAAPVATDRAFARLAAIETWREHEIDPWRRRLTGYDDRNGRLGRMDARIEANHADVLAAIAELRADVGTSEEARATRESAAFVNAGRRRLVAAMMFAATAAGGAVWGVIKSRDAAREAAVRADAKAEAWRHQIEIDIARLFAFHGAAPLTRTP